MEILIEPKDLPKPIIEFDPEVGFYKVWRGEKLAWICMKRFETLVDYEIAEFITWINSLKFCTSLSCAGHLYLDENRDLKLIELPWIEFWHPMKEEFNRIAKSLDTLFEKKIKFLRMFICRDANVKILYKEFKDFYVTFTIKKNKYLDVYEDAVDLKIIPKKVPKMTIEKLLGEYIGLDVKEGYISYKKLDLIRYQGLKWLYEIIKDWTSRRT